MRRSSLVAGVAVLALLAACGGGGGGGEGSGSTGGGGGGGGGGGPPQSPNWTAAIAFGMALGNAPTETSLASEDSGRAHYLVGELVTPSPTIAVRAFQKPPSAPWDAGQAISPVIPVPSAGTRAYESVQVRTDAAGRALAVWVYRDSLDPSDRNWTSNVFFSRRDPASGTWSAPQVLQSDPLNFARRVDLALEQNGTAWAVWTERTVTAPVFSSQDQYAIFAARFDPVSATWSTPERVSADMLSDLTARVATDGQGNPHAVIAWNNLGVPESTLLASRRQSTGVWTAPFTLAFAVPLNSVAPEFSEYDIAVDGDNDAIVMWREWDGTRHTIWARHFTVVGGWEAREELMLPSNDSGFGPKLAMDPAGNAFVAWHEFDGLSFAIWTARFDKGVGWTFLELISAAAPAPNNSTFPEIAFDAAGNALALWTRYEVTPNRPFVRANYYRHPTGWIGDETISSGSGIPVQVDVAMSPLGSGIAAWWEETTDPLTPPVFRPWSAGWIGPP